MNGLEVGIAFIQAYIFTVLTCVYLGDAFHLHGHDEHAHYACRHRQGRSGHNGFSSSSIVGHGLGGSRFAGAGVGIGYIFGKMIEAVARQPEAEGRVGKYMWIGFALVEAIALYGLVIAFIIMGLRK